MKKWAENGYNVLHSKSHICALRRTGALALDQNVLDLWLSGPLRLEPTIHWKLSDDDLVWWLLCPLLLRNY